MAAINIEKRVFKRGAKPLSFTIVRLSWKERGIKGVRLN
jgi:hypothetical protein